MKPCQGCVCCQDPPYCTHNYEVRRGYRTLFKKVRGHKLSRKDVFIFRCKGCGWLKETRIIEINTVDGPVFRTKSRLMKEISDDEESKI